MVKGKAVAMKIMGVESFMSTFSKFEYWPAEPITVRWLQCHMVAFVASGSGAVGASCKRRISITESKAL